MNVTRIAILGVAAVAAGAAALLVRGMLGGATPEVAASVPAPVLATGDLSGFGGNVLAVDRDRDTEAAFIEFNIPLLKTVETG